MLPEAQQEVTPIVAFKRDVEGVVKTLDMLDDKGRARLRSAAIVAVMKDPELLGADRASFMMALRMCAQQGVTPDGVEATLQTYNTKVKGPDGREGWIKKVQYQPMIRGIINRVLRSGKVLSFWAEIVYSGEEFSIDQSQGDRRPIHAFNPLSRQGDIIGVYSVAKMANGAIDCEPVGMEDIKKIRAVAKTQKVWDEWLTEKMKVAAMRRLAKRLPLSADDMEFIMNADEHDLESEAPRDVTPKETTKERLTRISQEKAAVTKEIPEVHWTALIDATTGFPGSEDFTAGVGAKKKGAAYEECPHDNNESRAADWLAGWLSIEGP
jgi:phage RecT family recombinase